MTRKRKKEGNKNEYTTIREGRGSNGVTTKKVW